MSACGFARWLRRHPFENPDSLQEFLLTLPQTFGASIHHFKKSEALAGVHVETGVEVHFTGDADDTAAGGGCCVSSYC